MSANMFSSPETNKNTKSQPSTPHTPTTTSKIPIPSPTPLRRTKSLRVSLSGLSASKKENANASPSVGNYNNRFSLDNSPSFRRLSGGCQPKAPPILRRGNSFVERGENGSVANRPRNLNIEPHRKGPPKGPNHHQSPARIRSLSLSVSNSLNSPKSPSVLTSSPRTPPGSPDVNHLSLSQDWDTESLASITSNASSCDHACVARNGTTFSGRSMKYVVHCNQHAGAIGEDYLTPTQRAHKQVKKLRHLLLQAQKDLEQKDSDIVRLTKEVVELRLYKAALSSPEDKSSSSEGVTVRENYEHEHGQEHEHTPIIDEETPVSTISNHTLAMTTSCTDSGNFEDFTNSSVHSKDSVHLSEDFSQSPCRKRVVETADKAITADLGPPTIIEERDRLVNEYELRIQELIKAHEDESHLLKQKHNDKVEELLTRISEINARYWQLVPDLEAAKERIKELEKHLDEACRKLEESDDKHKQMYLQMYNQGQQAAKLESEKRVLEVAATSPSRVSVPELLNQLQITQQELENVRAMYKQLMEAKMKNKIDPEITLQFLKSAIYYFLTDKENNQGHLRAIQSILGFTETEIKNIDQVRQS